MLSKIDIPDINVANVVELIKKSYKNNTTYSQVLNEELKSELISHENIYKESSSLYYTIEPISNVKELNKANSNYFYSTKIVKEKIGGIYSSLLSGLTLCPVCKAHAETIDHVLPKFEYTQYSITPINLVPLCDSCNRKKSNHFSHEESNSVFHPYFDDYDILQHLNAEYEMDNNNFIVLYYLDEYSLNKYKFNFKELYELDKVCSSLANNEINNWIKIANNFRYERNLKEIIKEQIIESKPKFQELAEPWKIVLYDLLINEFDDFYKFSIERRTNKSK